MVASLVAGSLAGADSIDAARLAPKVEVDHAVARGAAPPLADTGPVPGVLRTDWTVELPRREQWLSPSWDSPYVLVRGQVLVASMRGVDAYDATTGRPRWHYREPGRRLRELAVTGDAIVLWTDASRRPPPGRSAPPKDAHLVGLDADTGWLLWTGVDRWQPYGWEAYAGADRSPAGGGAVSVIPLGSDATGNRYTITGLDARTGRPRWINAAGENCIRGQPYIHDSDGSLLLLQDLCTDTSRELRRLRALDPRTGRQLWSRDYDDSNGDAFADQPAAATVAGGVTALTEEKTTENDEVVWIAPDGRDLGREVCPQSCPVPVSAGRMYLTGSTKHRDGLHRPWIQVMDPRTGRRSGRLDQAALGQLTSAGEKLYGASSGLDERLLPAGFGVIDVGTGAVRRMPLPFTAAFHYPPYTAIAGGGGAGRVTDMRVAGGRVYLLRALDGQTRPGGRWALSALSAVPGSGGPVELGGVLATDWPDACRLAPGHGADPRTAEGSTIGPVRLRNVTCRYDIGDAETAQVTIGWVAGTPEQARALLAVNRATATKVTAGDEAYLFEGSDDAALVMRLGRYIVVIHPIGEVGEVVEDKATRLAAAIAATLRDGPAAGPG
jgi:hypothetical protein